MPKHPMQKVYKDEHNVYRFRGNDIIQWLFNSGKLDLNEIAQLRFDNEDRQQLAQLLGYSISGYGELDSYVDDAAYSRAIMVQEKAIIKDGKKL